VFVAFFVANLSKRVKHLSNSGCTSKWSQPISRVLSWTVIHLGCTSPHTSSNLPEPSAGRTDGLLFGLAPSGVYRATDCYQPCGALLPHPFTLTGNLTTQLGRLGGLLSVALSVGSHLPGVTWRSALWSPDFPPQCTAKTSLGLTSQRLSSQLRRAH